MPEENNTNSPTTEEVKNIEKDIAIEKQEEEIDVAGLTDTFIEEDKEVASSDSIWTELYKNTELEVDRRIRIDTLTKELVEKFKLDEDGNPRSERTVRLMAAQYIGEREKENQPDLVGWCINKGVEKQNIAKSYLIYFSKEELQQLSVYREGDIVIAYVLQKDLNPRAKYDVKAKKEYLSIHDPNKPRDVVCYDGNFICKPIKFRGLRTAIVLSKDDLRVLFVKEPGDMIRITTGRYFRILHPGIAVYKFRARIGRGV